MIKKSAPTNQHALKQRLLDRAKALSDVAEVYRCLQVTLLICDSVALGVRAEPDILEAAYRDGGGRKYWDAHLSEPMPVYLFAFVLSAHMAETVEQLEMSKIAMIRALRDAAEASESWFIGDTSPLLAIEDGQSNFEHLRKVKVYPRAAVDWLLSRPKREHLVPGSLRRFLKTGESTGAKAAAKPRHITRKIAEGFVANYINSEQAAGRYPTLVGLEAAARQTDMRGGREYLRDAFRRSRGAEFRGRGRPLKAPTKIAEK